MMRIGSPLPLVRRASVRVCGWTLVLARLNMDCWLDDIPAMRLMAGEEKLAENFFRVVMSDCSPDLRVLSFNVIFGIFTYV